MSQIMFVGTFQDGSSVGYSNLVVETSLEPEIARATLRRVAEDFCRAKAAAGEKMEYNYNFGDVVEMTYDTDFCDALRAAGLSVAPSPSVTLDLFEHDEIWVDRDMINMGY